MIARFEFLVEDQSTEVALRELLPKLTKSDFAIHSFRGKSDLQRRLPERLEAYARWLPEDWCVVVLLDRDRDDCMRLKAYLDGIANTCGFHVGIRAVVAQRRVLNRIVIEELEAWFFGDWDAVRNAYPGVSPRIPQKNGFRDPDAIAGGTWEALERVLQRAGYFGTGLRKIEAARAIASHMDPRNNRSKSFQVFRDAVVQLSTL